MRLKRAGVPVEQHATRTKPEIALAEIDRVMAAGMRFGCVLADADYGLSAPFRQGLTTRGLAWALGIPRHRKEATSVVLMLEVGHQIIRIAHDNHIAVGLLPSPAFGSKIETVVQVNVGEQR